MSAGSWARGVCSWGQTHRARPASCGERGQWPPPRGGTDLPSSQQKQSGCSRRNPTLSSTFSRPFYLAGFLEQRPGFHIKGLKTGIKAWWLPGRAPCCSRWSGMQRPVCTCSRRPRAVEPRETGLTARGSRCPGGCPASPPRVCGVPHEEACTERRRQELRVLGHLRWGGTACLCEEPHGALSCSWPPGRGGGGHPCPAPRQTAAQAHSGRCRRELAWSLPRGPQGLRPYKAFPHVAPQPRGSNEETCFPSGDVSGGPRDELGPSLPWAQ